MAQMSFRIDDESKQLFENLCEELGLTPSAAFTLFIKKMIREQRIPFEISIYSHETLLAMEQAKFNQNLHGPFDDVESLMADLDAED